MKYLFFAFILSGCAVESTQEIVSNYEVRNEKTYAKETEDAGSVACPPRLKVYFEDETFKILELPCSKEHNTNPISDPPGWVK